ncbi:hypothetical protein U472_03390 [Orenia metallireducens]|uniref:Aminopeptidase-like domain-containing protein n=1 Tax=Orenia metallireducens TaxID=1413210 RepID=A0A1C0AB69_9FIRM|nr:DUF4910 domain-containing protein [Orenia metallireducens]OCL27610.1 hypothetical protein U472_03390 [Orenia metallireducens]
MVAQEEIKEIEKLFDRLFPICRSITGPGLRESLDILGEYIPLERFSVKTGTNLLNNWVVPEEWRIYEAWLKGPDGEKIVDFSDHNLHVVNYSIPVDKKLSLTELKDYLYTIPDLPEAIPYVTSYYKRRWGFCMRHKTYEKLKEGEYHAYINSELLDGQLDYGHAILPGQTDREILISTYLCHPSMANNELSGPLVATFLYNRLKKWQNRRFTYRFIFIPETIGAIAYLHRFGTNLKEKLYSGLVLTCLGGETRLNYKLTKRGDAPVDKVVKHFFKDKYLENLNIPNGHIRDFIPLYGSDERHYCSAGFNFPVGQMARLVYGYPEYHTSLDNKELITIKSLNQSINDIEKVLKGLELNGYYINQYPYGEIKLDQYNLYPNINFSKNGNKDKFNDIDINGRQFSQILTLLSYADGTNSLIKIAEKNEEWFKDKRFNWNILEFEYVINILKEKGLLKGPYFKEEVEPIWK